MFLPVFSPVSHAPARSRTCPRTRPRPSSLSGSLHAHGLYLVKAIFLMSLALLTLRLLAGRPAYADYPGGGYPGGYPGSGGWVPSPSAYTDSNGLVYLTPHPGTADIKNTYKMIPDDAAPWWFGAYGPNKYDTGSGTQEYGPPSLNLNGVAINRTVDPYGIIACFYDPSNYGFDRSDATPLPLDLLGSVTAKNKAPLSVDFLWTGPGPVPDHADFLISTHLSASAGANFGNGGATSGVSASAKAKLPDQKEDPTRKKMWMRRRATPVGPVHRRWTGVIWCG